MVIARKNAISVCWKIRTPVTTCRPSFTVFAFLLRERSPPPICTMKDLMPVSGVDTGKAPYSYDIKANEHLPHPTPLNSKDPILRPKGLRQPPQHHIIERINRNGASRTSRNDASNVALRVGFRAERMRSAKEQISARAPMMMTQQKGLRWWNAW